MRRDACVLAAGQERCRASRAARSRRNGIPAAFWVAPAGIWLPECGYTPAVEPHLQALGLGYFVVDAHAHAQAVITPRRSAAESEDEGAAGMPLRTQAAPAPLLGTSKPALRYGAPKSDTRAIPTIANIIAISGMTSATMAGPSGLYLKPYVLPDGARINTGFKYYSVTGDGDAKVPYDPARAARKLSSMLSISSLAGWRSAPPR